MFAEKKRKQTCNIVYSLPVVNRITYILGVRIASKEFVFYHAYNELSNDCELWNECQIGSSHLINGEVPRTTTNCIYK